MGGSIRFSTILLGVSFLNLATGARAFSAFWPIKTIDFTNGGYDCDASTEQYLLLEGQDWHDHPKFTLRWRQTAGPCGEAVDESDLMSWEASYDGSSYDAPDDPPTAGNQGRVELNLYVCSPFGTYEIDLDVESYSDESVEMVEYPASTSWTIRNGDDKYELWRTVYSGSAKDEYRISPRVPGEYTWPVEEAMGYYGRIIAGPLPPLECGPTMPARNLLVGCFADSRTDRLLNADTLVLIPRGPGGMTTKVCSRFCRGFDYFGLEFGSECFCGTAEEFEGNAVASDQCGLSTTDLCTGDPTKACGGRDAIRVYKRLKYSLLDCFQDNKTSRIMQLKGSAPVMSAQICYEMCNDGINKHFGTQYGSECWCSAEADLMKHGEVLDSIKCDMPCAGSSSGEYCGGFDKITAYEIEKPVHSKYLGCYADQPIRAMDAEGMHSTGDMTNEVCLSYCADKGHTYAGTQYASECWCGDSYDLYGDISDEFCSYSCVGDEQKYCGGDYALSVWTRN